MSSFSASQISILGGIADGITHVGQPAFVDEIHNQLHLMNTFKRGAISGG